MNFMSKIKDFTITYASWAAAGFPRRDPEWVAELFAVCESCDQYDPAGKGPFGDVGACEACGCHVGNNDRPTNKLVLPNTSCPLGKWGSSVDRKPRDPNRVSSRARALTQQAKWREKNQ